MCSRAQSETLGFVLVFAIITASIGIVYASGFTGLNEVREFEQVNNAERAFEVFADNIEDISHRNAPSRSTEIKLASAALQIPAASQFEVNDTDAFGSTYDLRPVVYDADTGTEIVYEQGAVIRSQTDGGLVVKEGTLIIGTDRTIIPIIQTRVSERVAVGGSQTVLIRADHAQTRLVYANDTDGNEVWFNLTTPRASVWHTHLTETYDDASCQPVSGNTVSCSVTTDQVYVTLVQIDLAIE